VQIAQGTAKDEHRRGDRALLYILLLLNEHRTLVTWMLALVMWVAAYSLYFRNMARRWFFRGRAHNWSIDMAAKKAVTNGKEEVY